MKKLSSLLIFLLISSVIYAQFNPPQNLVVDHYYIYPCNYFYLYWEPPEPGVPDLVSYNIYANWEVYGTVPEYTLTCSIDDAPCDSLGYVHFYITALYENPEGESIPSNIVTCEMALSSENNVITCESAITENFPNPFNQSTTFSFTSKEPIHKAEIKIYNIKGQLIRELRPVSSSPTRSIEITWDGKDKNGQKVAPGVYLYQFLIDGEYKAERKCLLIE